MQPGMFGVEISTGVLTGRSNLDPKNLFFFMQSCMYDSVFTSFCSEYILCVILITLRYLMVVSWCGLCSILRNQSLVL